MPLDDSPLDRDARHIYNKCDGSGLLQRHLGLAFARVDPAENSDNFPEQRKLSLKVTGLQFVRDVSGNVLARKPRPYVVTLEVSMAVVTMEGELYSHQGESLGSFTALKELSGPYHDCALMELAIEELSKEIALWSKSPNHMSIVGDK